MNTNGVTVGIAICCYKGHIPHLKRLFDSIETQSRLPDRIVVSCSSSVPEDIPYIAAQYRFPFEIIPCEERQNAAQNRNRAAAHLNTDVVSFFDADDIMHPRRVEFIHRCFTENDAVLLLHNIEIDPQAEFMEYGHPIFLRNCLARCPWGSTILTQPLFQAHIANGHVSVRAEVLQTIQYHESADMQGREDTIFSTDVITAYPRRTAYTNYKLSKYFPSRTGGHS